MDEKKPLDDQQIEAMLAPLRTHTEAKRSRLRPLVIGLGLMTAMLLILVLSLPNRQAKEGQSQGGPVATCGNGIVEPGEDCEPPNGPNCRADCLHPAPTSHQQQPTKSP